MSNMYRNIFGGTVAASVVCLRASRRNLLIFFCLTDIQATGAKTSPVVF